MTIRLIGALRISTKGQVEANGDELQRTAMERWAQRNNAIIVKYVEESGVSAFKRKNRPALDEMVEMVKEDATIDGILHYDFSRMDRQIVYFMRKYYPVLKHYRPSLKFYVTTKDYPWEPTDPDVMISLLFANAESSTKQRYGVDGQIGILKKNKESGKKERPGAKAPYGYKVIEKQLVLSEEAIIAKYILHLGAWGYTDEQIAKILTDANIPTPLSNKPAPTTWRNSTIDSILSNIVYTGDFDWNTLKAQNKEDRYSLFQNAHEPIISKAIYFLIRASKEQTKAYKSLQTDYLGDGLLKCPKCNEFLKAKDKSTKTKKGIKHSYRFYKCQNRDCKLKDEKYDLLDVNNKLLNEVQSTVGKLFKLKKEKLEQEMKMLSLTIKKEITGIENIIQRYKLNEQSNYVAMSKERVKLKHIISIAISKAENEKLQLYQQLKAVTDVCNKSDELDLYKNTSLEDLVKMFTVDCFNKLNKNEQRIFMLHCLSYAQVFKEREELKVTVHWKQEFLTGLIR